MTDLTFNVVTPVGSEQGCEGSFGCIEVIGVGMGLTYHRAGLLQPTNASQLSMDELLAVSEFMLASNLLQRSLMCSRLQWK